MSARARESSQSGFMERSRPSGSQGDRDLLEDVLQDLARLLAVLAGVAGDDAVREDRERELLDIVRHDVGPPLEERPRLGRATEREGPSRRDADRELGARARPRGDLDDVVDDRLVDADLPGRSLEP